jgi:hypothetical protein
MKRPTLTAILLAALILVVLAVAASAAETIPRALQGTWCGKYFEPASAPLMWSGDRISMRAPDLPCPDDEVLYVRPREVVPFEGYCRVTRVQNRWDPNIDRNTKQLGAVRTTVNAVCGGLDCTPVKARFDLYLRKGSLTWEARPEGKPQRVRKGNPCS